MVLAELGSKITSALKKLNNATIIDEKLLTEILNDISIALMNADVNIQHVARLKNNVKTQVTLMLKNDGGGTNMRKLIQKNVVQELTDMLDSDRKPYEFKKGKPNVVMFVGLQGAGKTTTCTKYAYHYMRKGWRVGLVCSDTFRAGAVEQLKQNAAKIKCPFYGHKSEKDPVKIASDGVKYFKDEGYEIIIIDTSGRHKQEDALFEEMQQVAEATQPDEAVFVMDSSIGQACFDQARAFRKAVKIGSVIVTKLDGHAKGGGALSAVAATESPIVFIGTGEHFDEFEQFEASSFIRRLLGLGDLQTLFKTVREVIPEDKQPKLMDSIQKGEFPLRMMKEQFMSVLNMGPLNQVVGMIPGMNANLIPKGREKEGVARIKRFLCMMDSMNDKELDGQVKFNDSRIKRVARGSGTSIAEVNQLLEEHKKFQKMVEKMGKMKMNNQADMKQMARNPAEMMKKMQSAVDPKILKQIGGAGNLMNMVKEMGNMENMKEMMSAMGDMGGMPGMGGGGGGGRKRRR